MGYTTTFQGKFALDRPLTEAHAAYLKRFSETRRMKRNEFKAAQLPDPLREAVELPVGEEGAYFTGSEDRCGQDFGHPSVLDPNEEPKGQPGLWCQWVPSKDRTGIEWNEREKFYDYVEWLRYVIEHFLRPWGYTLNGRVRWRGEEFDDIGTLVVEDNVVSKHEWEGGLLCSTSSFSSATRQAFARVSTKILRRTCRSKPLVGFFESFGRQRSNSRTCARATPQRYRFHLRPKTTRTKVLPSSRPPCSPPRWLRWLSGRWPATLRRALAAASAKGT